MSNYLCFTNVPTSSSPKAKGAHMVSIDQPIRHLKRADRSNGLSARDLMPDVGI